jgi:nucleoside-diphosphate-sugar epimerase
MNAAANMSVNVNVIRTMQEDITKSPGKFTHAYRRNVNVANAGAEALSADAHPYPSYPHGLSYSSGPDSDPGEYHVQYGHSGHSGQNGHHGSGHYQHNGGGAGAYGYPSSSSQPQTFTTSGHPHHHHHYRGIGGGATGGRRHLRLTLTKIFQGVTLLVVAVYVIIIKMGTNLIHNGDHNPIWWENEIEENSNGNLQFEFPLVGLPPPESPVWNNMHGTMDAAGTQDRVENMGHSNEDGDDEGNGRGPRTNPQGNYQIIDGGVITTTFDENNQKWRAKEIARARDSQMQKNISRRRRTRVPQIPSAEARVIERALRTKAGVIGTDESTAPTWDAGPHSYSMLVTSSRSGMMPMQLDRPFKTSIDLPPIEHVGHNGTKLSDKDFEERERERKKRIEEHEKAIQKLEDADVDDLCGSEARFAASSSDAGSYKKRDALNESSRVLITGILNPLGFHLALALKHRCGVNTIMGIDNMFPNSVKNRLEMIRRMTILSAEIPGLTQPIMLSYVGLDPKLKASWKTASAAMDLELMLPSTGEINFLAFRPTHIVHLASAYPNSFQNDVEVIKGKHHIDHVYATESRTPPLYQLRMANTGMEHILSSISSAPDDTAVTRNFRPHFVYASSPNLGRHFEFESALNDDVEKECFHSTNKMIDEMLATSYSSLNGVYSVGLRMGDVYGPWGLEGYPDYELGKRAVYDWERNTARNSSTTESVSEGGNGGLNPTDLAAQNFTSPTKVRQFIFVDDVVNAVISSMQFRTESEASVVFDLDRSTNDGDTLSNKKASLGTMAAIIESFRPNSPQVLPGTLDENSAAIEFEGLPSIGWSPRISLLAGISKLLAWHLNERLPYGPASNESGRNVLSQNTNDAGKDSSSGSSVTKREAFLGDDDEAAVALPKKTPEMNKISHLEGRDDFLARIESPTCDGNDWECNRGVHIFPCVSECSFPDGICKPSIFDGIVDLLKDVTAGCDIVLYTASIGYDVEELRLEANFLDDEEEDEASLSRSVCNIAFVPSDSDLVSVATTNVPKNALEAIQSDEEKLAGKAVPSLSDLSHEDRLDLLNGRILHKGWILIWVPDLADDETDTDDFWLPKLSPGRLFHSDVQFVMFVDENMPLTPNSEDVNFLVDEMQRQALAERPYSKTDENGKKIKYILPAEPERHAALLVNTIKQKKAADEEPGRAEKLSVYDASKFMVYENGGDPSVSNPKPLKRQREFYERVSGFINREDLRSPLEPVHKYELRHWIRSRWVLHDLRAEEARQLRCDWFLEHSLWGNPLDQLSFAHMMAIRDVQRKVIRREPDDRMRASAELEEQEELPNVGDKKEWYTVVGADEALRKKSEPTDYRSEMALIEEKLEEKVEEESTQYFTRIMSDRIMLISRRIWSEKKKKKAGGKSTS